MSIIKTLVSYLVLVFLLVLNGCGDDSEPLVATVSVTPSEAPVGKKVTITGINFSPISSENAVEFNGISAPIISSSNTSIQVKVPKGATTGRVSVTTNGNSATSTVDFVVNDCSGCGTIEKFALSNDYHYSVEPINGTKMSYSSSMASRRGINFSVDKKVRLKSIGGLFRKNGNYPIELRAWASGNPILYATTISVNDTENFVYKEVETDIQLLPGFEYVLRYCGENHDSVYDILPPSTGTGYLQPFDFGLVNLNSLNYEYIADCSKVSTITGWQNNIVFMRGIVDFKYEIIE